MQIITRSLVFHLMPHPVTSRVPIVRLVSILCISI